jgi:hypothetical protein
MEVDTFVIVVSVCLLVMGVVECAISFRNKK